MIFSISMCVGAWAFFNLSLEYLSEMVPPLPFDPTTQIGLCYLSSSWCNYISFDFPILATACWALIQSIWVLFVVLSQFAQIGIEYTTNEAVNYQRFEYLMHPDDLNAPAYRRRYVNPFDNGPIANCGEFWMGERENYRSLYEVPMRNQKGKGYAKVSDKTMV